MKAAFYTLGCKVNQYESRVMGESLERYGVIVVPYTQEADVYVVNSCTVTAESDRKSRRAVRRFKKLHPFSTVVLTGCVPQAYPELAFETPEADIIMGNNNHSELFDLIEAHLRTGERIIKIETHTNDEEFEPCRISKFEERTRAYVKIEDGCNRFCSYCAIPYSRGRVRSKKPEDIAAELELLADNGYSEIVFTGINLSAFCPEPGKDLSDAVMLAEGIDGIKRIRLGSLEADSLNGEMIDKLRRSKKLCPQFHISLQSGCDDTLRRMNRHYTASEYENICKALRESFDDCALTTDVMVGFAGETDEEFEESLGFVKRIAFEKVHVFPYSVRKGTAAEKLPDLPPKRLVEQRTATMIEETEKIRASYLESLIGRRLNVLAETEDRNGFVNGYTANYTPVKLPAGCECGKYYDVTVIGVADGACHVKL